MTAPTLTLMCSAQNWEAVGTIFYVFSMTRPGCEPDTSSTEYGDAVTEPYPWVTGWLSRIPYWTVSKTVLNNSLNPIVFHGLDSCILLDTGCYYPLGLGLLLGGRVVDPGSWSCPGDSDSLLVNRVGLIPLTSTPCRAVGLATESWRSGPIGSKRGLKLGSVKNRWCTQLMVYFTTKLHITKTQYLYKIKSISDNDKFAPRP